MTLRNAFADLATDAKLELIRQLLDGIRSALPPAKGKQAAADSLSITQATGDTFVVKSPVLTKITGSITAAQPLINTPVPGATVVADCSELASLSIYCTGTFAAINCTFEASVESVGDNNWFAVQALRTNANLVDSTTGSLSAAPVYAWKVPCANYVRFRIRCTARTSGQQDWVFSGSLDAVESIPGVQAHPVTITSGAVNSTPVTPVTSFVTSASGTNGTIIKASASNLFSILACNSGTTDAYLKLHNATAVTVGTTTVVLFVKIPAGQSVDLNAGVLGLRLSTGICISITGAAADADTTPVAAGQVKAVLSYL